MIRALILAASLLAPVSAASAQAILNQNFDNVSALFTTQGGWAQVNGSVSPGSGVWHQGATGISAHVGATNACISNDFSAGSGVTTISSWLITPVVALENGQTLQFYTRTRSPVSAPDRLQVRLSLAGADTTGLTANGIGTFTTLLLDINPNLTFTGYPTAWTAYSVTFSGIPAPTQGRIGFRYFVTNGGPAGVNSDVVVIDTLTLTGTPTNTCQNPLPACNGDITPSGGDGAVNVADLLTVITTWGMTGPPRPAGDTAPLPNGNCLVNVADLLAVISTWGTCPGPVGACCTPSGQCAGLQTQASCVALGGVYQGNNSSCAQVTCPQPNNDICETAVAIPIGGSASENLQTATTDFSPTCSGVVAGQGRWHKVVGTGTNLTASTCLSSGAFNGRLSVYCGPNCNRLLCVAAADNNTCAGTQESVTWCAANGQTYWILVHAQTVNPGQGLYTLTITGGSACGGAALCSPVNNNCASAIPIFNGVTAFSTIGATTDGNPVAVGACNDSGATQTAADIWFLYTATCTGTLRVTTCAQLGGSTDYDSDIVIYTVGACPPPDSARIGCNDDDPNNPCGQALPYASTATATVIAGQQYLIRVGGFSDEKVDFGTGTLNITCGP